MEQLKRTYQQFADLFKLMSPSQRATLVGVTLMVVGTLAFVMFNAQHASYVALSWGKTFTTEELINAEQALLDAELSDFRREGQRLMVPSKEVDRYNAALLEGGSLPENWAAEWEKQQEKMSPFGGPQQREEGKEIARAKLVSRTIRAVPDIEHADVIWARGKGKSRWARDAKVTATVNVLMRKGRRISMDLVQSLQTSVASMVPDLDPANVTVFDQREGISYPRDRDEDPFDSKLLKRIQEFEDSYRQSISAALAYIPDVLVNVNVDVDNLKRSVERTTTYDPKGAVPLKTSEQTTTRSSSEQSRNGEPGSVPNQPRQLNTSTGPARQQQSTETNTDTVNVPSVTVNEKELSAAMPKAVQVTVSISEDYYRAVAMKRGNSEGTTDQEKAAFKSVLAGIKTEVELAVEGTVAKLIPAGSAEGSINVGSYVPVDSEPVAVETPIVETVTNTLNQWGSAVGLGLFALWALWMLNKSMQSVSIPTGSAEQPASFGSLDDDEEEEDSKPAAPTSREELQVTARDNPELAAAVLSRWIQEAR